MSRGLRRYGNNRSIGQCSTWSAGHGRVGLAFAGPDGVKNIFTSNLKK
jgi:hypothetical protein